MKAAAEPAPQRHPRPPQAQQPQRGPASSGTKRPLPQQRREPKAQPEAAGSWQCDDCGRGFDTSKGLSNHKRRCDGLSPNLRPTPSPAQKRVRFSRAHPDVAIGENGATVRYNAGGMDAYWQTAVCGGHVMRSGSGRHTAHFTVLQGGRTLNVGVAQDDFDPKGDTNASDGPQGWGFDSETGGYWHEGWLQRGLDEGATASLQELVDCGGVNLKESDTIQVRLPSLITIIKPPSRRSPSMRALNRAKRHSRSRVGIQLTLDMGERKGDCGRLAVEVNGTFLELNTSIVIVTITVITAVPWAGVLLGVLCDNIAPSKGRGLCWMVEVCAGEAVRVRRGEEPNIQIV